MHLYASNKKFNFLIKRINDLDSSLNDISPDNQVRLSGSVVWSHEMSLYGDKSLDAANIEYIKDDSDKMYDMASYCTHTVCTAWLRNH